MAVPQCLTCKEQFAVSRGRCQRCNRRHRPAVKRGLTTWEKLEAAGLAAPVRKPGEGWRH
jgi:hypothetical protein